MSSVVYKSFYFLSYFRQYCIDNKGILVEITSAKKQEEVDKFLDGQDGLEDGEGLWMALRKYECWVWTSDTPMCHVNWESEPSDSGGLA